MNLSLETKALGWAAAVALLSLGSAWLAAISIKAMPASGLATPAMSSVDSSSAIVATPEVVAQGHEFFETSCSECHGDDATGDEGPNLHNLTISNARISATIKKGIKGEMPTFAKKYDDKQIAAIVTFLRTLR
jgi:mono/diheme cytochrome c family protein